MVDKGATTGDPVGFLTTTGELVTTVRLGRGEGSIDEEIGAELGASVGHAGVQQLHLTNSQSTVMFRPLLQKSLGTAPEKSALPDKSKIRRCVK